MGKTFTSSFLGGMVPRGRFVEPENDGGNIYRSFFGMEAVQTLGLMVEAFTQSFLDGVVPWGVHRA